MPDLTQFNAEALKERVTETVRAHFGMLIPEDEWTKLVDREVFAFFAETAEWTVSEKKIPARNNYGVATESLQLIANVSPFRALVWEHVRKLVKVKLDETLNGDALKSLVSQSWTDEAPTAELGGLLERKLESMAPTMVRHMFEAIFAKTASDIKEQMRNSIPRTY